MENKKIKIFLTELAMCFLQIVFSKIYLFDFLSPVGLSFAFVRVLFGGNIILINLYYFLSRIFLFFDTNFIFITFYEVLILTLFFFFLEFIKTKRKYLMMNFFAILSKILEFYYSFSTIINIIYFFINLIFNLIFIFYFYKLFDTYKKKLLFFRFSHGDYIIFSIFCFLLGLGIFGYTYSVSFIEIFILTFLLLIFARVLPKEKFLIFSSLIALAISVVSENYFYLIFSIISSLFLIEFKDFNKWIFSSLSFLIFLLLIFIFNKLSIENLLSIFLSSIFLLIIPFKWIKFFSSFFDMNSHIFMYKFIQDKKTENLKIKLNLLSNTFLSMHRDLKFLLVGKIDRRKACEELTKDLISKWCLNCENYNNCFMQNINKRSLFENLLMKSIETGDVEPNDITNGIEAYCTKSSILTNEINQIAKVFHKFENSMKNEDESKLMISDELKNVSDIFANFSNILEDGVKVNEKRSKTLKENLINALIDAKESLILENKFGIESVNIIASNDQVLKSEILEVIFKTTKLNFKLKNVVHTEIAGLSFAKFVPKTKLRVEFSVATKSLTNKNGDNVIVSKLDEEKYFVALADGMGHGEKASRISKMVLSLIKSMFQVGLDENLIIQSVNRLLIPAKIDNFSTLDVCVVDLKKNMATFVKLGSSVSILKHKQTSEIVASESLPIGMINNIRPTIINKPIRDGESIFVASDGIVDSFSSIDNYKSFVNDAKIFNMQKFVDNVLFDAQSISKHPDDMTIIAVNLLKNY